MAQTSLGNLYNFGTGNEDFSQFLGNVQQGGQNPSPTLNLNSQQNGYQFQGGANTPTISSALGTTPSTATPVAAPVAPQIQNAPMSQQMPTTATAPAVPNVPMQMPQNGTSAPLPQTQQVQQANLTNQALESATPQVPNVPRPGVSTQVAGPMVQGAVPSQALPNQVNLANSSQLMNGQPNPGYQPITYPTGGDHIDHAMDTFVGGQDNPRVTAALANDPNVPDAIRKAAASKEEERYTSEKKSREETERFQKAIQSGNLTDAGRMIQGQKGDEGSYLKAYLFRRLGLNDLAQQEQQKLAGNKWMNVTDKDGNRYLLQYNNNNLPIAGLREDGSALNANEIGKVATSAAKYGSHAYSFTGETGIIPQGHPDAGGEVRQRQNAMTGNVDYVYTTGDKAGQVYTGPTPASKSFYTQKAKMDYGLITDLQKKHAGNVLDAMKEFEQLKGPLSPEDRQEFMKLYGYGTTIPGGTMPPGPRPTTANLQTNQVNALSPQQPSGGAQPSMQPGQGAQPSQMANLTTNEVGALRTPIASLKQQRELGTKAAEKGIEVQGNRSQAFNKYIDEDVADQSAKADVVSNSRKQQFGILKRLDENGRPVDEQITGLYNAANQNPSDQKWTMVRDIFAGQFQNPSDLNARIAELNLSPKTRAALIEFNAENGKIASQTLRETAGPGSVSDAEQAANKAKNVDIGKTPMIGVYQMMGQSQFNSDLARYKSDLAADTKAPNRAVFDREFRAKSASLINEYRQIAEKRLEYIQKNGNTPQAIRDSYKAYPVPEYNPNTQQWDKRKPLGEILK